MNKFAILHNQYSEYAYAISKNSVHLLLRTAKDDLQMVELLYGDPFIWKNRKWLKKIEPMHLRYQTDLFDYYFIEIEIVTKRLRYAFILTDKLGNKEIYHSRGYMKTPNNMEFTFLQEFFNYPYILEADLQKTPTWVKDTVWYQIFVDRFNNIGVNSKHDWNNKVFNNNQIYGGNLKGVTNKLKYLKTLGYNGIYFNPLFEATTAHKYDTIDYFKIDPSFGTNEDFKELVEKAHELGIKVMLDGVFNHCSYLHPWFQDVIKNKEKSKYLDCFFINQWPIDHLKDTKDYDYENIPNYEVFATTPFMPKWNTEHPLVKEYLLNVVSFWIKEYNIDGWRLDVSNELSMKFLREIKNVARNASSEVYILGENWDNSLPWLKGDQLDGVMNYLLTLPIWNYLEHKITLKEFEIALNSYLAETPKNLIYNMFNLVGCHDTIRITTRLNNDHRRAMLAYLLIYSSSGSISVYYGDEIGMFGENDPDNRRTMRWDELEWDLDTLKTMKKFNDLRHEYVAFKEPDYYFISQGEVLAYYKKSLNEEILFVINNTDKKQTYQLTSKHIDIFSKQFPKYNDIIKLEPYGFMILKKE